MADAPPSNALHCHKCTLAYVFEHLELRKIVCVNFDGALEHNGPYHMDIVHKIFSVSL